MEILVVGYIGVGKTSLINFMRKQLEEESLEVVVDAKVQKEIDTRTQGMLERSLKEIKEEIVIKEVQVNKESKSESSFEYLINFVDVFVAKNKLRSKDKVFINLFLEYIYHMYDIEKEENLFDKLLGICERYGEINDISFEDKVIMKLFIVEAKLNWRE